MKIVTLVAVLALVAVSNCANLRNHEMNHQLPFLDSLNPLQMVSLMSGDYASILPSFLQPLARKILGTEQKGGAAGFLQSAQGLFGGNNNPTGGLLGGMGNMFSQAGGNSGSGGILSSITNAFGGASSGASNAGSSALGGLGGLSDIAKKFNFGLHE